jgi:ribosomal-protein-alanine N-acetyltransferase
MEVGKMNVSVDISNVIIETKRLIIRPWKNEDLNDFYEYASVDGVGQMAGWNPHKSKEESQEILKLFIEDRNVFSLELKANRKVIGSIGLEKIGIDLGELYTSLRGREIGYVLSKEYWGQGLMPEVVMRVMDYCYKDLNCEFLQCSHAVENEQSKRVIEKVGFQYVQDYENTVINGNTRKSKVYVKQQPYEIQS